MGRRDAVVPRRGARLRDSATTPGTPKKGTTLASPRQQVKQRGTPGGRNPCGGQLRSNIASRTGVRAPTCGARRMVLHGRLGLRSPLAQGYRLNPKNLSPGRPPWLPTCLAALRVRPPCVPLACRCRRRSGRRRSARPPPRPRIAAATPAAAILAPGPRLRPPPLAESKTPPELEGQTSLRRGPKLGALPAWGAPDAADSTCPTCRSLLGQRVARAPSAVPTSFQTSHNAGP